ncbi:subtilisin-like protein [Lactarius pseudohatsudake]|nr:subtilisin-like protein [Lactarius pseudohatsudake]
MRHRWITVFFLSALGGIATSPWDHMRSKHSWETIPENWQSLGLPTAHTTIDLYIALKPYRENALVDALNEVSDPRHPSFLTVTAVSVSQANDLLGASYQLYTHTKTNETIVRTLRYSLPVVLHGHVQTVAPTTFFSSPVTQWQTPRKRSGVAAVRSGKSPSRRDNAVVTPAFLRWLYSTVAYVPSAMDRNKVGVTGYNQQYPSPADLASYMRKYRPDGIDATYVVELVNGGEYDPNNPGKEANVDIQLSEGLTYPTPHIFYSTKAAPSGDFFFAWLGAVLSKENGYAIEVCHLFAQLGTRGASVLFASGDDGVGRGDCTRFTPVFPATCPYVTAVGGTTNFGPEVAASLSGGGFSEYFGRPEYQHQAVTTFLNNLGQQYSGLYNPIARGIPDISAQARMVSYFLKGEKRRAKGTSCSAPIVAGIISLLNDYRLSQGKPPLGFLNPWLYGGGLNGLNDIVSGSNPGCNTNGFSAAVGWDPVTGLGTPDFLRLMDTLDAGSSNPPE